jgi:hypothetical protein
MPTQRDVPSGIGARDEWGLYGPGAVNKVQAVSGNDGDNSVIFMFSHGAEFVQTFTFPVITGITDPVSAAAIGCYARQYQRGNAQRVFTFYWNGAETNTPDWGSTIDAGDPAYVSCGYGAAAGGLALAAVNGQHGMRAKAASGTGWEVWVTAVFRDVTYAFNPAAITGDTQFAHLLGSIAAMIGGNLLLREMPAVSRALGNIRLLPSEYETAWREWRAYKHPVSV